MRSPVAPTASLPNAWTSGRSPTTAAFLLLAFGSLDHLLGQVIGKLYAVVAYALIKRIVLLRLKQDLERAAAGKKKRPLKTAKPVLLAGGNPQIGKANGDSPVQTYIAAMPGWKRISRFSRWRWLQSSLPACRR